MALTSWWQRTKTDILTGNESTIFQPPHNTIDPINVLEILSSVDTLFSLYIKSIVLLVLMALLLWFISSWFTF